MKITVFKNFQNRKGNYELVKVLNAIKECKFNKEITQLREADSEEEKGRIKNSLLAFTPSVELNTGRKFTEGDSYNGIIHLDYDKLDDVAGAIEKIKALEYTYSCFISPSGDGIKVFVRVSNNAEQHKDAFNTLRSYYVLSIFNYLMGGTLPNRDEFKNSHLDHIMPQRWFNNRCWREQNINGESDLKNAIKEMKEGKTKDVLISLFKDENLWSDNSFSNSFIQLIGNKFQIYSKTNIDKSNNFWNECDENTNSGDAKTLLKSSFSNINSAFCIPEKPKVWEYDKYTIETIVERTEIIVKKITKELDEFKPRFD